MEVARTSMIHAAAPHFLWPFAVRYAAHQLKLWPRVSEPKTSPTLWWTGKFGDASVFRVWGALSLVHDAKASKLSSRTLRCVFLGFPTDAPPWQFYHLRSRRVFSSQDVTFDESLCYYRLHPHASHPIPLAPLFLVTIPPSVDPFPPQGPAPSAEGGDPAADETAATRPSPRLETPPGFPPRPSSPHPQPAAMDSGAEIAGAEPGSAETEGEGSGGAATGGDGSGGAATGGAGSWGAATGGADSGGPVSPSGGGAVGDPAGGNPGGGGYGPAGAGAASPGGTARAGGTVGIAGGAAGAGGIRGTAGARGAGATRPRGATGAGGTGPTSLGGTAGAGGAGGAGGAAGAGGAGAGGTGGAGAASPRGARTGGAGAGGTGAAGPGGARAGGAGAAGASGAVRARGATGAAGSGGTGGTASAEGAGAAQAGGTAGAGGAGGATGAAGSGDPEAGGAAGAGGAGGATGATGTRGAGGTAGAAGGGGAGAAATALRRLFFDPQPQSSLPPPDSSQPQLLPGSLLPVPAPHTEVTESLTERREPETRASTPVRARRVTRPRSPAVPGTHGTPLRPSSVPQRVVLPEPRASSLPHIPDPESNLARAACPTVNRLFATVVTDPDLESTAAFSLVTWLVDFAARSRLDYVASLVTESESVCPPSVGGELALGSDVLEDIQIELECLAAILPRFASMLLCPEVDPNALDIPTPHSCAEAIAGEYSSQWQTAMDAEMASWKSTGTYIDEVPPPGANIFDSILRRLIYGLRQAPREWNDTLGITLAALGFVPSSVDPSLFLCTDTTLLPFYVLVYVDDLVFATADTEALALMKAELQERHTCTDLGELRSYLGLQIIRDRARRTITLTQSHMVHQVLQRFGFLFSSPQPTPLSAGHLLSAPPSDESLEPSGPYPRLVGCLMYLITCTRPVLAYPLSLLACYMAPGRHRKVHLDAAKRVLRYMCSTSGMGLVLGGQSSVVLKGHSDASWADDQATERSSLGYTFCLGSGSVSWRSTRSSSMLSSSCEVEIYTGVMAAQEPRWLTYLLTDLGERPRSPPVLYVDNKAMLALCHEQRLEHRTKHIALHYFLARELQQHRQLCLSYVASRANTADVFTKAIGSGDHQRF
ncbi:unnamed protein product [Closterium sp. NIES-53]